MLLTAATCVIIVVIMLEVGMRNASDSCYMCHYSLRYIRGSYV